MPEAFDRQGLQDLLFQHRTRAVFPPSEDDRPNHDTVVICYTPPDELLHERGARIYDDVLSEFPLSGERRFG